MPSGTARLPLRLWTARLAAAAALVLAAIERTWKNSKAEKAESLVGKQVPVRINPELYKNKKEDYLAKVRKFFELAKVGDSEKLDVKRNEGDALIFLELTKEQNERVAGTPEKAKEGEGARMQ